MDVLFLIGLALAPGAAIGLFIWLKDQYDREPLKHLFISFMLGVLCAVPAVILSIVLGKLFPVDYSSLISVAVFAFITVAFAEEFAKFLILRFYAYRQKEFNEPFDGIVYGAIISLGFAGIENILYVTDGGVQVGLLRMFTAVPAHASFGIIMGYYFGLAWQHKERAFEYKLKGLLAAVFLHGLYDFFLMQQSYPAFWFLSFVGLALSIRLCFKAMKAHNLRSPFKTK
ncbi:PrsW family intramembrane metalloprotease [Planktosalinus lacus]|uniref:Protease PrsW n=1 Tax=Planktosalinus lacus TaxID=1526573 RepID=A0A8J2Y729_9FLAO|nr:PrsW family glutamic-type intramembrane protease [Planktosalinus lacus]GGD85258.1 protease PrsW [Planktosalinus lacus]